jgi:hypothetical protein
MNMGHDVIASARVTLPDTPQQMAETLSTIAGAWSEFLAVLDALPMQVESTFSVNETRAKPGPKPAANGGTPRTRRARTTTNSGTAPEPPPGEAAAQEAGNGG